MRSRKRSREVDNAKQLTSPEHQDVESCNAVVDVGQAFANPEGVEECADGSNVDCLMGC